MPPTLGETRRILSVQPTYDWTCFSHSLLNVSPMPVESSPPLPCPTPCHLLPNCTSCLDSKGADGGWQHCVWSSSLQQVLPSARVWALSSLPCPDSLPCLLLCPASSSSPRSGLAFTPILFSPPTVFPPCLVSLPVSSCHTRSALPHALSSPRHPSMILTSLFLPNLPLPLPSLSLPLKLLLLRNRNPLELVLL